VFIAKGNGAKRWRENRRKGQEIKEGKRGEKHLSLK